MQPDSLKYQVQKGIKWTAISNVLERVIRFLTTIFLARLLAPEMFGLIAMANLCIELIGTLRRIGFGLAYIQRQDKSTDTPGLAANTMFWLNSAINLFLFLGGSLLAPVIAEFFKSNQLESVLRFMFISFLLDAVSMVPNMDLQKRLEFRKQAICEITQGLIYPLISISLALKGFTVWSIVYGLLASRVVFTIMVLILSGWQPRFQFNIGIAKELFSFGKYMWAHTILISLGNALDKAIVGRYYGATKLGLYSMAFSLCDLPASQINLIINKVTFPALSQIQDDSAKLKNAFMQILSHVSIITLPIGLGLLSVSEHLPAALFGPQWQPMVPLVKVLVFYGIGLSLSSVTGPLFLAIGRPKILLQINLSNQILKILLLILLKNYGALGICYAVTIPWALATFIYFYVIISILGLSSGEVLRTIARPSLAALCMFVSVKILEHYLSGLSPEIIFFSLVTFAFFIYLILSWLINRSAFMEATKTIRTIIYSKSIQKNTL